MPQLEHPASKPFIARGSKVIRCEACLLPKQACICGLAKKVEGKAVFWLLTHRYELYKPTNTGRLIVDTIGGSRVFDWNRTEPDPELMKALSDPTYSPYIVFPSGDDYQERMVSITPDTRHDDGIPAFIILDGTWRQARRMFRHGKYLHHLPVVEVSEPTESSYRLRKSKASHHLCTAEVAVAMLKQAGEVEGANALQTYFNAFNERYYAARTNRPVEAD